MRRRDLALLAVAGHLLLAACGAPAAENDSTVTALPTATAAPPTATRLATASPAAVPPSPTAAVEATRAATAAPAAATRVGADYVLLLPREAAVPAGWVMNPVPDYEARSPAPDETYRFACRELPARSVGLASVGYRSLDGLPRVRIEYAVYPSAEAAGAALADMQAAVAACPEFTIGEGDSATAASFSPRDFPTIGDEAFAATLSTSNATTGDLVTHFAKVRQGHVVISIFHAGDPAAEPLDNTLMEDLAGVAVSNLAGGPPPPQP